MSLTALAFAVLAGTILFAAYKVVATPSITHAALYLALVLVSVGGLFVLLEAPFLGAIQVLVYVGAVIAIVVFAIMLSEVRELSAPISSGLIREFGQAVRSPYLGVAPVLIAAVLTAFVMMALSSLRVPADTTATGEISLHAIGSLLFGSYLLPLELGALVLLVVVMGAIVLASERSSA